MPTNNAVNVSSAGIVGFNGTAFVETTATNHAILVGGATSSTFSNVGPTSTSGQVLQSAGASADPAFSTATYPATATGTGTILRADGTNWAATTATYPNTAGTSGNVLTSNGTNWSSSAPASQFIPNSTIQLFDDFVGIDAATNQSVVASAYNWEMSIANGSWVASTGGDSGHLGVIRQGSFTSNNRGINLGQASANGIFTTFFLGGGTITLNWVFKIAIASDSTNRYILRCGLGDTNTTTADQANGVYFEYSDNINSGNWNYRTASASVSTTSNSSVAATAAYHNAQMVINAAATSVSFSVDGVSLGTAITTNIPTAAITPFFQLVFVSGTIAASTALIDLFYMSQVLTTAR